MKSFFMSIYLIAFVGFAFLIGLGYREENTYRCLVLLTLGFGGLIELIFIIFMGKAYDAVAEAAVIDNVSTPRTSEYADVRMEVVAACHNSTDNKAIIATETWEEKYQRELRRSREIDRWMREEDAEQERIIQRKEDGYSTW